MEKFDKAERDEFFQKNKELINSKNVIKIFQDVYAKAIKLDIKIFYDFLGELLLEKPILIIKRYLRFVKKAKIPRNRLLELETYLIEKYCIFDSEEVLLSFYGSIRYLRIIWSGRVFVTNYRIFVIGKTTEKMDYNRLEFRRGVVGIKKWKRKMDEIIRAKTPSTWKEKPYLGYQFPITNPSLIRLRRKELRFRSEGLVDLKIKVLKSIPHCDQIIPKIGEILHNLKR